MALTGAKGLLRWCQQMTEDYDNVNITNMTTSWRDGLAFCAILHHFRPEVIDYHRLSKENIAENNRLAFSTAESEFGIPSLLDVDDMVSMAVPDKLSIMTYVSQYYSTFKDQIPVASIQRKQSPPKRPVGWKVDERPPKKQAPEHSSAVPGISATKEVIGSPPKTSLGSATHLCAACGKPVYLMERLNAENKVYHRICFKCSICGTQLRPSQYRYIPSEKKFYCDTHYRSRTVSANSEDDIVPERSSLPSRIRNLSFGKKAKQETPVAQPDSSFSPSHNMSSVLFEGHNQQSHYESPFENNRLHDHHDFDLYGAHTRDSRDISKQTADLPNLSNDKRGAVSVLSSALNRQLQTENNKPKKDLTRIRSADTTNTSADFRHGRHAANGKTQGSVEYDNPLYGQQIDLVPQNNRYSCPTFDKSEYAEPRREIFSSTGGISSNPFLTSDKKSQQTTRDVAGPSIEKGVMKQESGDRNDRQQVSGGKKKQVLLVKKKKTQPTLDETDENIESNPKPQKLGEHKDQLPAFDGKHGFGPSRAYPVQRHEGGLKSDTSGAIRDESKSWAPTYNRNVHATKPLVPKDQKSNEDASHKGPTVEKKKKLVLKVKKGRHEGQAPSSPGFTSFLPSDQEIGAAKNGNNSQTDVSTSTKVAQESQTKFIESDKKASGMSEVSSSVDLNHRAPARPMPPRAKSIEELENRNNYDTASTSALKSTPKRRAPEPPQRPPDPSVSKSIGVSSGSHVRESGDSENAITAKKIPVRPQAPYNSSISKSVGNLQNGHREPLNSHANDQHTPQRTVPANISKSMVHLGDVGAKGVGNQENQGSVVRRKAPDRPVPPSEANVSRMTVDIDSPSASMDGAPHNRLTPDSDRKPSKKKILPVKGRHSHKSKFAQGQSRGLELTVGEKKMTREEMQMELKEIERQQRDLEQRGVVMEKMLREKLHGEPEEEYMIDWFNLVTEKNWLLRRENELIYLCQELDYFENQKSVENELRQLLEKDDRMKSNYERKREEELLEKLVSFVTKRSSIVDKLEEDRVREKEEDEQIEMVMEAQGLTKEKRLKKRANSTFYC